MNPTGRNMASDPGWKGRRSPWIGTKNIWKLFYSIGLLDEKVYKEKKKKKPQDWSEYFANIVYDDVERHKYFMTNLGKCTQVDARALPNCVLVSILIYYIRKLKLLILK